MPNLQKAVVAVRMHQTDQLVNRRSLRTVLAVDAGLIAFIFVFAWLFDSIDAFDYVFAGALAAIACWEVWLYRRNPRT